ncbi:MAG TPA: protein kinase [Kofleriaceae bacterium]
MEPSASTTSTASTIASMTNSSTALTTLSRERYSRIVARCPTCHRRLRSGQPCPTHRVGGDVVQAQQIVAPSFEWSPVGDSQGPPEPVGALIGSGGFASVWALTDRVIKIAHASHELARARMAREAEALRAIGAPAVPRLHDSGVTADGRAWVVMDRVAGANLADLASEGPMRSAEVVALGLATLDALERVHTARFVHRDIKPDNLVRTVTGRVVILDLGLARKLPDDPDDPTRAHVQVGSLEYIAPEQIADSAAVDERSDIYALGCVLYELLAGRPPFVGDAAALERAHTALRPPRLGALVTISAAVESLIHDCLAKEPARRPASAAEVRERLAVARDERTPPSLGHSVSMIREGKQPVVLLWAELPRVDRALLASLTGRRLVIASQRGRKVLAGVLGGEHADPASIAIAAARELAGAGAHVALHLEALRVSTSAGASTLHGKAVDNPETWLPGAAWTGVIVSDALASVTQAATRTSEAAGFRALGEVQEKIELVGREALLGDLITDAAAALLGVPDEAQRTEQRPRRGSSKSNTRRVSGPAFALLVGDAGVGKTAFAHELATRLGELGVRVHAGTVPAPGGGKPGHSALAELIGTVPKTGIVRAVGDALRAAARAKPTAVILDDLHLAEHELLDALEYATLGGEPLALWVLGVASPRIDVRRPQLGNRAERRRRDVLAPLDEDAAVALTAALLRPAEYPPLRALRRLAAMAHGNPLHLMMLAREIHQRGAIRERAGGAHFLDTSALDELSPAALGPWLAARELADLSGELVALARLCAVLGGEMTRDELGSIVEAVEQTGGATTTIDVDIGLRELVAAGILAQSEHGYTFRQALVEEGVYATTNEEERLALHRAALAYWRSAAHTPEGAERAARHAEVTGDARTAAAAFAALGDHAFQDHRLLDADQAWSGALRHLPARDGERAHALLGRAQARYRLQRMSEALVDLEEATAIAAETGELYLEVETLIEQGTVLDFIEGIAGNFERSQRLAARARERLGAAAAQHAELAIDLDLADARTLFREQKFAEGAPLLRDVIAKARALGSHETATIGALLLGPVLSDLRELDEAEQVFADMIEGCLARGDRWHLAAAYGNRAWLWSAKGMIDRTEEDLRLVIQLARESGQAHYERVATHNLAETKLWRHQLDDALQLARRGLALQSHAEGSTRPDRMLLARVLAARAELAELREVLATFSDEADLADEEKATLAVLHAVAAADQAALGAAIAGTDNLYAGLRFELAILAARAGVLDENRRVLLRQLAGEDPLWAARVAEL